MGPDAAIRAPATVYASIQRLAQRIMATTMDAPPVRYVRTQDGYDIAYTLCGEGRTVVFMPGTFSHVQLNWSVPSAGSWHRALSERFHLVHFDYRGRGMSTRGLAEDFVITDFDLDLAAVMDRVPQTPVVLVALTGSSHIGVRYAVQHAERVQALVVLNGYVSPSSFWLLTSGNSNWEVFLESVSPGSRWTAEQRQQAVYHYSQMTTHADWKIASTAMLSSDIGHLLPYLTTPTLVLQIRDYKRIDPLESLRLAALAPNARLMVIDGDDAYGDAAQGVHAIETFLAGLIEGGLQVEPSGGPLFGDLTRRDAEVLRLLAAGRSNQQIEAFLMEIPPPGPAEPLVRRSGLSPREREVLCLIAAGKSNQEIADALVLSLRTVERHITNLYGKIGARGKADATAYALRNGLV